MLIACGSQTTDFAESPLSPLQVVLVSADFAVGRPRVSFALFDGPEPAAGVEQVDVQAFKLNDELSAGDAPPVWVGAAAGYSDYEIPYWVFYPDLQKPGYWGIVAEAALSDGGVSRSNFILEVLPQSKAPALGAAAPPSQNRTLATEPDISLLSSANDPDPALYRMTVADAVASGKPTVVGFLTPGFCQTKWCAPVLESVEAAREEVGDQANFIHVEVYDDFQRLTLVKEMAEWGLDTEPWVFVLDKEGRVAAKFSGPLSPRELLAALKPLL